MGEAKASRRTADGQPHNRDCAAANSRRVLPGPRRPRPPSRPCSPELELCGERLRRFRVVGTLVGGTSASTEARNTAGVPAASCGRAGKRRPVQALLTVRRKATDGPRSRSPPLTANEGSGCSTRSHTGRSASRVRLTSPTHRAARFFPPRVLALDAIGEFCPPDHAATLARRQ